MPPYIARLLWNKFQIDLNGLQNKLAYFTGYVDYRIKWAQKLHQTSIPEVVLEIILRAGGKFIGVKVLNFV